MERFGSPSDRSRLKALDACLLQLEDAAEGGAAVISANLASRLTQQVPGVRAGLRIKDGLDLVFRVQEMVLGPAAGTVKEGLTVQSVKAMPQPSTLTNDEARKLTDRIKIGFRETYVLLYEAHERRAWVALGYRSWAQYVRKEFDLSRSRSYELLDQCVVVRRIMDAAGTATIPELTTHAACEIKPFLNEVSTEIRRNVAMLGPGYDANAIVQAAIKAKRAELATSRRESLQARPDSAGASGAISKLSQGDSAASPGDLIAVLEYLAELPPAAEVAAKIWMSHKSRLQNLHAATTWLREFEARCNSMTARLETRTQLESAVG